MIVEQNLFLKIKKNPPAVKIDTDDIHINIYTIQAYSMCEKWRCTGDPPYKALPTDHC